MVLIEGIGDEVLQALGLCLITLICVMAWRTTAITELPHIRTVFILGTRTRTANNDRRVPESVPSDTGQRTQDNSSGISNGNAESSTAETTSAQSCSSTEEVNARRLAYFSQRSQSEEQSCNCENSSSEAVDGEVAGTSDADTFIRIKLKYLNDDQKIVRGNLHELLGEFKRRYFEAELSNNKSVLLIFRGRVLNEQQTLERIGMYDNCVVHCLVKAGSGAAGRASSQSHQTPSQPDPQWNLTGVLCTTVSLILLFAWFAHVNFPQFFTMTSTSILLCLTAIFFVSVIGLYYPEFLSSSQN